MFVFEGVAAAFFIMMLAVALRRRQIRAAVAAGVLLLTVALAATLIPVTARGWLPHAYLAFGYWIPAWMTTASPSAGLETWLARGDLVWSRWSGGIPPAIAALGDLAYVLCYPLVPLAFGAVWASGTGADVDRFWTAVLIAGFICYGTLPWIVSRPPRLLENRSAASGSLARANTWVLSRISHQRNTFPSGHVAVSLAAALTVAPVWPAAGALCGVVAAGVAVGAVTGRYHYLADVLAGLMVGVLAASIY